MTYLSLKFIPSEVSKLRSEQSSAIGYNTENEDFINQIGKADSKLYQLAEERFPNNIPAQIYALASATLVYWQRGCDGVPAY